MSNYTGEAQHDHPQTGDIWQLEGSPSGSASINFIKEYDKHDVHGQKTITYDFEKDKVGAFPQGWQDLAVFNSDGTVPTALVIKTPDAWGHLTHAVQLVPRQLGELPNPVANGGIYREIKVSDFYTAGGTVRVDSYSDYTDFDCGCPKELYAAADHVGSVAFWSLSDGPITAASITGSMQIYASSRTEDWRLLSHTKTSEIDVSLNVPAEVGKWYDVKLDVDAKNGFAHTMISDATTGEVLSDMLTDLSQNMTDNPDVSGIWDQTLDGKFNAVLFNGLEFTAVDHSAIATFDNLSVQKSGGYYDNGDHHPVRSDGMWSTSA